MALYSVAVTTHNAYFIFLHIVSSQYDWRKQWKKYKVHPATSNGGTNGRDLASLTGGTKHGWMALMDDGMNGMGYLTSGIGETLWVDLR